MLSCFETPLLYEPTEKRIQNQKNALFKINNQKPDQSLEIFFFSFCKEGPDFSCYDECFTPEFSDRV